MPQNRIKVFEVLECGGPGGTGNQVAAICNGLDPERFDIGLVFSCRDGQPEAYRKLAAGARFAAYVPEMTREISPWRDWRALWRLVRLFRAERPDVVHAHSSKAGTLARLAAVAAGTPRVFYSPHGYGFLQLDRRTSARAFYRAVEASVSRIGRVVAVSPAEAALARPLAGGNRVCLIRDADLGEPAENLRPVAHAGLVLGACGRLTAARNPGAFTRLVRRLTELCPDLRCVWIGDGELRPEIEDSLEGLRRSERFELTGWLDAEAVRQKFLGLDFFVHYSAWDAIPNVVLEAMASGLPVVASDIPANRGLVTHGQTGFLARSEAELLDSCVRLAEDPSLRRRLGDAGRQRIIKDFSRDRMIEELSRLYSCPET